MQSGVGDRREGGHGITVLDGLISGLILLGGRFIGLRFVEQFEESVFDDICGRFVEIHTKFVLDRDADINNRDGVLVVGCCKEVIYSLEDIFLSLKCIRVCLVFAGWWFYLVCFVIVVFGNTLDALACGRRIWRRCNACDVIRKAVIL